MADHREPWMSERLTAMSRQLQSMSAGNRAALRRMRRDAASGVAGTLIPLLIRSGVGAKRLVHCDEVDRWARIVQVLAILSGPQGKPAHAHGVSDDNTPITERDLGRALRKADWSEARMMRLISARGDALASLLAPMARFLTARGMQPLDLSPLAELVLQDGRSRERADTARLKLATGYFAQLANETPSDGETTQ